MEARPGRADDHPEGEGAEMTVVDAADRNGMTRAVRRRPNGVLMGRTQGD